jgi:hypothetical protein
VCQDRGGRRSFSDEFDDHLAVGPDKGNEAFFGRNVLRGLVEGIDDFINLRQPRWRQFRSLGPVLLGSAMWIDDPELIEKLGQLSGASIVITKQTRTESQLRRLEGLHEVKHALALPANGHGADPLPCRPPPLEDGPYGRSGHADSQTTQCQKQDGEDNRAD